MGCFSTQISKHLTTMNVAYKKSSGSISILSNACQVHTIPSTENQRLGGFASHTFTHSLLMSNNNFNGFAFVCFAAALTAFNCHPGCQRDDITLALGNNLKDGQTPQYIANRL
uniref:Uncharacterized protein n=1 Tax=Glossina palpalis gambiensis TaxID=67801 RepID=A0A1B0BV16_9MUSC